MKLNVDAGFDSDTLTTTFGAVILDHSGKFIAAANEKMDLCFDSFTAEAIALRFGLNLANTVGCSKIEVNSDSVEVVNALSQGYSSSVASSIIDDCYFIE
jgi:ribonuclease HI